MKVFIVLFACIILGSADDWKPKSKEEALQIREECLKLNNVPEPLVEKVKKFEYEDEESVRCHIKCTAEKVGVWDNVKGYDVDRLYDQVVIKEEVATNKDDLKKCIDDKHDGEDDCTWAYRNFKCMLDNKYLTKKA